MLSLGYPKINFQVANSMAQDSLMEVVKEMVQQVKESDLGEEQATTAQQGRSKEQAFQVFVSQLCSAVVSHERG